jgi:hypothetical protein
VCLSFLGFDGVYKNMKKGIVALVLDAELFLRTRPTEEAAEARLLTPDEVRELMDQAYACRLLDALDKEVSIRSHDGVSLLPVKCASLETDQAKTVDRNRPADAFDRKKLKPR